MDNKCYRCINRYDCWSDYDSSDCGSYMPEDDDACINRMIEERRVEFYREWFAYIGEYE